MGLAVSGGALVSIAAAPTTASAKIAHTPAQNAALARGKATIKSRPLLRLGDSGPTVKWAQKTLRVAQDGYYGKTTVAQLKKFQASWGIKATGTTDHATWGRLTWAASHKVLFGNKGGVKAQLFREKVLKEAAKLKGTPYRYGGTTTRGFDCSGYTGYVYKKAGKKMPRTSRQQYAATTHISAKAAKPGDLIFFKNGSSVYHVGIYAGKGLLWHSSKPGTPIQKGKIWTKSVAFGRV